MINHLQETAIDTEGLFRISGSLTAINELIKAMDAGKAYSALLFWLMLCRAGSEPQSPRSTHSSRTA